MLTPEQVAKWLNAELTKIYKWISTRKILHIKLSSKAVRFSGSQ